MTVTFYEKPGCASNAKQKRLLQQAGVPLEVRNLLTEPWTAARLRHFFAALPLESWFNPAAPRIKSGEVKPAFLSEDAALQAMLEDPLLIRRPLIETDEFVTAGFDWPRLSQLLGLEADTSVVLENIEKCSHPQPGHSCRQEG